MYSRVVARPGDLQEHTYAHVDFRWKERLKLLLPVGLKKWVLHRLGWHITRNRRETNR